MQETLHNSYFTCAAPRGTAPGKRGAVMSEETAYIKIPLLYVQLTGGDWLAAALLAKLDGWMPAATIHDKHGDWVAKTANEWAEELFVTASEINRAISIIKKRGLATWKLAGFNGRKTTWWQPKILKKENSSGGNFLKNKKAPRGIHAGNSLIKEKAFLNLSKYNTQESLSQESLEREIQHTTPPSENPLENEKPKAALNAEGASTAPPPADHIADAGEMVAAVQPEAPLAEPVTPPAQQPAQPEHSPLEAEAVQPLSPQSENSLSLIEATAPALTPELSARWTFARTQIEYLAGNSLWSTWLSRIEFTGMDGTHLLFSAPNTYIAEYVQNRVNREMRRWLADCGFGDYEALTITVTAATIEDENPFASPVKSENSLSFGEGVDRAARENNFTPPPTDAQECYRLAQPKGKDVALLARLITEYGATAVMQELRRINGDYEAGNMTRYLRTVLENKRKAAA